MNAPLPKRNPKPPAGKAAKAQKPAPPPPEHHLQFALVDPQHAPLTDARKFKISWVNTGEKTTEELSGAADARGLTPLIKTKGKVGVTLEVAPPDGSACKLVGTVDSKPLDRKPQTKVQLKAAAEATSATKPSQMCATVDVRDGKQKIQYVIKHVTSNGNSLRDLPYLVVDADKLEVLSDSAQPSEKALLFKASGAGKVVTEEFSCDGVKKVGLVLGNATDDPKRWKRRANELVLYQVQPRPDGLTQVIITEEAAPGDPGTARETPVDAKFQARLYGLTWAHFTRAYSMDDVRRMLPGRFTISTLKPTDMQLDHALGRGAITETQAQAWRAARTAKPEAKKPEALTYTCAWAELLAPIYEGQFSNPPPPENPLVPKLDEKKKPVLDDKKKPVLVPKFSEAEFAKKLQAHHTLVQRGGGSITIAPLGLTLSLLPDATNNAHMATGLSKAEILSRTHPYAYMVVIEGAASVGFHRFTMSSTWRPQLGSVLHKLGDAIDATSIDSETDGAKAFSYAGGKVDALARNFASFIAGFRYARADRMYYVGDDHNEGSSSDQGHDDHLHFTVDRMRAVAAQDKAPAAAPPAG